MTTATPPAAFLNQQQYALGQDMAQQQLAQRQAAMQQQEGAGSPQNAQTQLAAAAKYVQDQAAYTKNNQSLSNDLFSAIPDFIKTPAEWVGAKMYQVYTNVISRPITTAFIAGDLAQTGQGSLFDSQTWDHAYADAAHVSPGQVATMDFGHFFSGDSKYLIRGNSDGSIIWDHPDQVHNYFDHGTSQWVSGGMDAALSWYADPASLAGKYAGMAKDITYTKAVSKTANQTMMGAATVGAGKLVSATGAVSVGNFLKAAGTPGEIAASPVSTVIGLAGKVGGKDPATILEAQQAYRRSLTGNNIQNLIDSSTYKRMGNLIESQKASLGDRFPEWVTQQKWAQTSAGAGGMAQVLSEATTRDDIDSILKIGMGDPNEMSKLLKSNANLAVQAKNIAKQRTSLISNFGNMDTVDARQVNMAAIQQLKVDAQAIDDQSSHLTNQMQAFNALKDGLYFNNVTSPLASRAGQWIRTNAGLQTLSSGGESANAVAAFIQNQGTIMATSGRLLYNNLYARPMRVFGGALADVRPNGWVNLNDVNSHVEVRAEMDQSKVWSPTEIQTQVSKYINTPTAVRGNFLRDIESQTTQRMAQGYGLNEAQAKALYNQFDSLRGKAFANATQSYSPATIALKDGTQMHVHEIDDGQNGILLHPVLSSQLQQSHVFMDTENMDRILKYNARGLSKLLGENPDMALNEAAKQAASGLGGKAVKTINAYHALSSVLNTMWKFNTLFRLGYGPRAMSDDLLSQIAQFGGWQMTTRSASGATGQVMRRLGSVPWYDTTGYDAKLAGLEGGIASKQKLLDQANAKLINAKASIAESPSGRRYAAQAQVMHQANVDMYTTQLEDLKQQHMDLVGKRAKLGDRAILLPTGQVADAPFGGKQGRLYQDLNSGRRTMDVAMGGTSADLLNSLRAMDWKVYQRTDTGHMQAWVRGVNDQIKNDPAAMRVVKGDTPAALRNWIVYTNEGRAYYKKMALANLSPFDQADRVFAHVNHYLPPSPIPELRELRNAVASGRTDAQVATAMANVPMNLRPSVSGENLAAGLGHSYAIQAADKFMSGYYKIFNELPVETLSRNPLFAHIYDAHIQDMAKAGMETGITSFSPEYMSQMSQAARKLALQDVKKFTYNMDFETKLSHMVRNIAPFFGPTQEAYRRWARIVADKPEILARNALVYSSPSRAGYAVDQNGEKVTDGYATDPSTGKKYLVPKNQIHIQFQMPNSLAKTIEWASGANITQFGPVKADMPLQTFNMVMRDDPWFSPGYGPWVQMAANHFAKTVDPQIGDVMRKLGILPYGISKSDAAIMQGGLTRQISMDDSHNVQAVTLQMVQDYNYQYTNGLIKQMPSWNDIQSQAQHWVNLKAWLSGTSYMPISSSFKDPYQYFRDAYKIMQAQDPKNADANFMNKFGSSAYAFTQSLYKNNQGGLPATPDAVQKSREFAGFVSDAPHLAELITGNYAGSQGFSETAWQQQVNSGARTQMTAQEAWAVAQANLGWQQYSGMMAGLKAQLYQRGLDSFTAPGAKDLAKIKAAGIQLLSSPYAPDGISQSQYYNPEWTKAYGTRDPSKDDSQAIAMAKFINMPEIQKAIYDKSRPDLAGLQQYLILRQAVKMQLASQLGVKGGTDINSRINSGLKQNFTNQVMSLMEGNTRFEDLHDRFLSKDMFDHYASADDLTLAQQQAAVQTGG
jgi:hypothetical protein